MTARQTYAAHVAMRWVFRPEALRRLTPSWWLVQDSVWSAVRDYDAAKKEARRGPEQRKR